MVSGHFNEFEELQEVLAIFGSGIMSSLGVFSVSFSKFAKRFEQFHGFSRGVAGVLRGFGDVSVGFQGDTRAF